MFADVGCGFVGVGEVRRLGNRGVGVIYRLVSGLGILSEGLFGGTIFRVEDLVVTGILFSKISWI
jgi:hypothetical protein